MKKFLAVLLVTVFCFCGVAFAGPNGPFEIEGEMIINSMAVYGIPMIDREPEAAELKPLPFSHGELEITFFYETQQGTGEFVLFADAFGDVLNQALWVSRAINKPLAVILQYRYDPMRVRIVWVETIGDDPF